MVLENLVFEGWGLENIFLLQIPSSKAGYESQIFQNLSPTEGCLRFIPHIRDARPVPPRPVEKQALPRPCPAREIDKTREAQRGKTEPV